jgi:hypothetical protein
VFSDLIFRLPSPFDFINELSRELTIFGARGCEAEALLRSLKNQDQL